MAAASAPAKMPILASGCRHLIFRTSWVHAARGTNFVRTILRLAGQQDELRIVADQCGAPTGAELVADVTAIAIAAAARQDDPLASGIYHLAAAGRTTWHEFARFIVSEAIERGAMLRATEDAIVPIASSEYHTAAKRPANSAARYRQAESRSRHRACRTGRSAHAAALPGLSREGWHEPKSRRFGRPRRDQPRIAACLAARPCGQRTADGLSLARRSFLAAMA